MAKTRTRYVCQACGEVRPRWAGRCPSCGEWNTLVETLISEERASATREPRPGGAPQAQPLSQIPRDAQRRLKVPMAELDRVLGGGIVPGAVVLVSGDPGIGKSTLLLQLAAAMGREGSPALYVSGEESAQQLCLRADRLALDAEHLLVLAETELEGILDEIEATKPCLAIVDSVQSVRYGALESSPGSVTQVRECTNALLRLAKARGIPIFIVGHVTKSGAIAGPRIMEHMVDTVLYLEGERFHAYRLLRSVKNRFGSTDEIGVFEMRESGMVEVPNPSQVFLEEHLPNSAGSTVVATLEGTRPLLVEIQALASRASLEHPRRTCNGVDINRLLLLTAVLSKRVGLRLGDQDLFVNLVGGLRIREPAVDLGIAIAVASSHLNRPVRQDLVVFGEVGLAGELRSVGRTEQRLREAAKLGFCRAVLPKGRHLEFGASDGFQVQPVRTLAEAIDLALTPA
ncbi:MAG: DNA repair protein RadA [Anaerolineae bacterium]|jgi:DNA repair protein RadA/Sms